MNDHRGAATPTSMAERRNLGDRPFVSLAEALTWIAFGDAMTLDDLRVQLEGHRLPVTDSPEERLRKFFAEEVEDEPEVPGLGYFHDRQSALDRLTEAWRQLRDGVDRGEIKVRGRFTPSYSLGDERMADVCELTGDVLATFSQFDISTGGIQQQPPGSPAVIHNDHPEAFERGTSAADGVTRFAGGYLCVEAEREGVLRICPRPVKMPRKSHEEVVAWCRRWIDAGRGNGMDKAWLSFSAMPEHDGLSREHVFRPAWKEAKAS